MPKYATLKGLPRWGSGPNSWKASSGAPNTTNTPSATPARPRKRGARRAAARGCATASPSTSRPTTTPVPKSTSSPMSSCTAVSRPSSTAVRARGRSSTASRTASSTSTGASTSNTRLGWPSDCATIAGENPNTAPPSAAGPVAAPRARSAPNAAVAEPARPSAVSTVTVASPPHAAVTGANSSAGSAMPLFHMRLMPSGALSAVVCSGGCPSPRACGVQVRSQAKSVASDWLTAVSLPPRGSHQAPVTQSASAT